MFGSVICNPNVVGWLHGLMPHKTFGLEAAGGFEAEEVVGAVEDAFAFGAAEIAFVIEAFELDGFFFGGGVAVLLEVEDGAAEAGQ